MGRNNLVLTIIKNRKQQLEKNIHSQTTHHNHYLCLIKQEGEDKLREAIRIETSRGKETSGKGL